MRGITIPKFHHVVSAIALIFFCASGIFSQELYVTNSDLPLYIRALHDRDPNVRREAAEGLYSSFNSDQSAEGEKQWAQADRALVEALHDPDVDVRRSVVRALASATFHREKLSELGLIEALKDPDYIVRKRAAAGLLIHSKSTTSALLGALHDHNVSVRLEAARALYCGGSPQTSMQVSTGFNLPAVTSSVAASVAELRALIKDRSPFVRIQAVDVFRCTNFNTRIAMPILAAALRDPDINVRRHVARTIRDIVEVQIGGGGTINTFKEAFDNALRPPLKAALPSLINLLESSDRATQLDAEIILRYMGADAREAVPALVGQLSKGDPKVRASAISALGSVLHKGDAPIPRLLAIELEDSDNLVRLAAVRALDSLHAQSIPSLIATLRSPNPIIRRNAANALYWVQPPADEAVPALAAALKDPDAKVRFQAIDALQQIGNGRSDPALFSSITPEVISALRDSDPLVRQRAVIVIGYAGTATKSELASLITMLGDPDWATRNNVARTLGELGVESRSAVTALVRMLTSGDSKSGGPDIAADELTRIAAYARDSKDTDLIDPLEQAAKALRAARFPKEANEVDISVNVLKAVRLGGWFSWLQTLLTTLAHHPWAILVILWLALWFFCPIAVKFAPLWIWEANEFISVHLQDTKLEFIETPVQKLLVIGHFQYHANVLDAWVLRHLDKVRARFETLPTLEENRDPVPGLPVKIGDDEMNGGLGAGNLKDAFSRQRAYFLILGEGGAGKTNIACQIARFVMSRDKGERPSKNPMLPVLIEQSFQDGTPRDESVIEIIRGKLGALLECQNEPSSEFVKTLLRTQRILVIVDGLSEMNEASRKRIRPDDAEFDANALVVTSRFDDDFSNVSTKTTIRPLRVPVEQLTYFIKSYLAKHVESKSFDDGALLSAPVDLHRIVEGRPITVLLAKMYAQAMIDRKNDRETAIPGNVPDLMLGYLNHLNRPSSRNQASRMENREVQRVAKKIAWECLKNSLHPTSAKYANVLKLLASDNAVQQIGYLSETLRLLQITGEAEDQVSFTLDPLAEYLGALWLVEHNNSSSSLWREFLATTTTMDSHRSTRGFLQALRDCCVSKGAEHEVPAFVTVGIDNLLDSKHIKTSGRTPESDAHAGAIAADLIPPTEGR